MESNLTGTSRRIPRNKGKLLGQKAPLRLRDIWAIRIRLQLASRVRELALFDLAIDSKLRSCDLVKLRVRDVAHGGRIAARAIVMQQKTQRPVQFEITEPSREALDAWVRIAGLAGDSFLFPSRHQGFADLPPDEESPGGTAAARALEAAEHGSEFGYRGRRRVGDGRADGGVTEIRLAAAVPRGR